MTETAFPDYLTPIALHLAATYNFDGEIAKGKTGQTYKLRSKSSGLPFCLKTVSPLVTNKDERERVRETLKKEVNILEPLSHRCLPQVFAEQLDGQLPFYICTYHPGKTLVRFKQAGHSFSREEGIYIISSLIDVLQYLHAHDRTHCDLHAENILISESVFAEGVLLIDFGSGHRATETSPDTEERGFLAFKNGRGQARFRDKVSRHTAIADFQEYDFKALGNALSLMAEPLFGKAPRDQFISYQEFCHHLKNGALIDWRRVKENFASVIDPTWLLAKSQKQFISADGRRTSITIPVAEYVPVGEGILDIVNTKAFQRLRHTKQLSFCDWYYPGGIHSRFEHSLGVLQTTLNALNKLVQDREVRSDFTQENIDGTVLAALLHDIGHYPFAHVVEHYVSGRFPGNAEAKKLTHHFEYSLELIQTNDELRQAIEKHWDPSAITEAIKVLTGKAALLSDLLDGPIDCDKLDYVRRDAHHCGVSFGDGIDVKKIISAYCRLSTGKLGIWSSGIPAVEGFMIAQSQMLSEVYWQEHVRSAICMFHAFLAGAVGTDIERLKVFVSELKHCAGEHEAMQNVVLPWLNKLPKSASRLLGTKEELSPLINLHFNPNFRELYRPIAMYSASDQLDPRTQSLTTIYQKIVNQQMPTDATSLPIKWDAVKRLRVCFYEAFKEKGRSTGRFELIIDVPWGKSANRIISIRDDDTDHEQLITDRSHLRGTIFSQPTAYLAPIRVFVSPKLFQEFEQRLGSIRTSAEEKFHSSSKLDLSEEI
jgi:serine/threonine protein kinase